MQRISTPRVYYKQDEIEVWSRWCLMVLMILDKDEYFSLAMMILTIMELLGSLRLKTMWWSYHYKEVWANFHY